MNEREGFGGQKTLNLHKEFNYKKPEELSSFVLRRKALETFARTPFKRYTILETKNNKPLIFF